MKHLRIAGALEGGTHSLAKNPYCHRLDLFTEDPRHSTLGRFWPMVCTFKPNVPETHVRCVLQGWKPTRLGSLKQLHDLALGSHEEAVNMQGWSYHGWASHLRSLGIL